MGDALFVVVHSPDGSHNGLERSLLHDRGFHADQLLFERTHHGIGLGGTCVLAVGGRHPFHGWLSLIWLLVLTRERLLWYRRLVALPSGHEPRSDRQHDEPGSDRDPYGPSLT